MLITIIIQQLGGAFVCAESPVPSFVEVRIEPRPVPMGQSFSVTVIARNDGSPAWDGYITLSFPDNPVVRILSHDGTCPTGRDPICPTAGTFISPAYVIYPGERELLNYRTKKGEWGKCPLAETCYRDWQSGVSHFVHVEVTPRDYTHPTQVYIRLSMRGYDRGCPSSWPPIINPSVSTQLDQQEFPVLVEEIQIALPPTQTPTPTWTPIPPSPSPVPTRVTTATWTPVLVPQLPTPTQVSPLILTSTPTLAGHEENYLGRPLSWWTWVASIATILGTVIALLALFTRRLHIPKRRRGARRERDAAASVLQGKIETGDFHVFLCHNSEDKPAVKEIGERLKERGILPWLDEWELRPGLPWQRLLEEQISQIKSAAVFVGESGIGPWQNMELEAFLRQFVTRGCPVIPVILPDCKETPELPIFLGGMTWVDFRKDDPDPMEQLTWGITGERSARLFR